MVGGVGFLGCLWRVEAPEGVRVVGRVGGWGHEWVGAGWAWRMKTLRCWVGERVSVAHAALPADPPALPNHSQPPTNRADVYWSDVGTCIIKKLARGIPQSGTVSLVGVLRHYRVAISIMDVL